MKLGIRFKLFLVSVGLIIVAVMALDAWMSRAIGGFVTAQIRDDLTGRATAIAHESSVTTLPLDDLVSWDRRAVELGRALDVRVTIVRADGRVIGDSEVEAAALATLDNHAWRPEIAEALLSGRGTSERLSTTLGERLLYVGVAFDRGGQRGGVVRVARPLRDVDAAVGRARRALYVASIIALGVAAALAFVAAHRISVTMRKVTDVAWRMANGDLDVRAWHEGSDELSALTTALDALATSLSSTLGELRAERDLQSRILQGMQEGLLVLDGEDRAVLVNAALRSMLLIGNDVVGRHFLEVLRIADLASLLEKARRDGGRASGEIQVEGIKPRRILVHVSSIEGDDRGLLVVFVDVTDMRRLESLRRDFVANVSHELRTPVAAVLSATETLRTSAIADPATADRFLSIVERNGRRLQALIEDLLELSRLDAKEYRVKKERVNTDAVVSIVAGLYRERAERKGVSLELQVSSPPPVLESDARALEQILGNLVDNAVKYCPRGARVTLRVERRGEEAVRFTVEDSGPGVEARHLPRLFERFYRVDAGRSRDVGGTGLGLSIVKHLTEAVGGKVDVTSEVGRGSTFIVEVPLAPGSGRVQSPMSGEVAEN